MAASDEQLARAAQAGDRRAADELVRRYERAALALARNVYVAGADRDDVDQEARIGLLDAVRSYDPTRAGAFLTYWQVPVRRRLIDALKRGRRGKHLVLTDARRAAGMVGADGGEDLRDAVDLCPAGADSDPQAVLEGREELRRVAAAVATFSEAEAACCRLQADGATYAEIAVALGKPLRPRTGRHAGSSRSKAVDNALQRGNRKIRAAVAA